MNAVWLGWLLSGVGVYAGLGILFAIPFVVRGVGQIDPQARAGSWGFRLLILPGAVAFWPLLWIRWAKASQPPEEWNAHRRRSRSRLGEGS